MAKNIKIFFGNKFLSELFYFTLILTTINSGDYSDSYIFSIGEYSILEASPSRNIDSNDVKWETSILNAMDRAKKEDKPILVELYADWCNKCKILKSKILSDKDVQKSIQSFITVRLNGEEFPNLMDRYEAKGFPTILFLDKFTNYISKIQGLPDKNMLIRESRLAFDNSNIEKKLLKNLKESPNSLRAQFEMGIYYYQSEDYSKSGDYFLKITKQKVVENTDTDLIRQSLYNLALIRMNQNNFPLAISIWNEYISRYKDSSLSGAYLHRGIAWRERKEYSNALLDLNQAKKLAKEPDEIEIIEEEIQFVKSKN